MATSYDQIAYPSQAFRQTHPRRLAAMAQLLGRPAAPIGTCRVLDVGGGDGANIIPMAYAHPQARFVGLDLSAEAVRRGQAAVADLGLTNVELIHGDIMEADFGPDAFDYIIAHGVYAWVPAPVREALLGLIRRSLAPNGVGFVSYNAFPGCHIRIAVRDLLLHAVRHATDPAVRLEAAIAKLREIADTYRKDEMFSALLVYHANRLLERSPAVLAHDELGEVYDPLHLHEFIATLEAHKLAFLTEADGDESGQGFLPPEALDRADFDLIGHLQDLDFQGCRSFRQALVVHADPPIDRRPQPDRVLEMHVAGSIRQEDDGTFVSGTTQFKPTDAKVHEAVVRIANAWPASVPVVELIGSDVERAAVLLRMSWAGLVELQSEPSGFITAGERPVASAVARRQAALDERRLTALNHAIVEVEDAFSRSFIAGLDGARTRDQIAADMAPKLGVDAAAARVQIDRQLETIARMPLLVG
ncbi:MAG TPA: class I SAM-dependent methyltransferase [Caulobacteraceae bacterium]|jgi:SAM-dependent methyltransferase|nr:class I SAM-dependent methyltransferase [Caulobacteraceae bacterium]